MGAGMMGWSHMGWGLGWIMMIVFWTLVILGIIALVKWVAIQGRVNSNDSEPALEILRRRYARGEIIEEEFKKMREKIFERR